MPGRVAGNWVGCEAGTAPGVGCTTMCGGWSLANTGVGAGVGAGVGIGVGAGVGAGVGLAVGMYRTIVMVSEQPPRVEQTW